MASTAPLSLGPVGLEPFESKKQEGTETHRRGSDAESTKTQVGSRVQATALSSTDEKNLDDIYNEEYPDGGLRAWLIVLGAAFTTFSTFGYVNSWGVFQAYYQDTLLKDSAVSNIAWIGSIQYALVFIPALITGHAFDRGHLRVPLAAASALLIAATFLTAECTKYWQFLLCQGFAVGIACGVVYGPMTAVIGHWFKYRRGLATGVTAVGSSVGGTVFPIVARNLIPRVGFPWTLRVIGFILLFSLGTANLLVRRRLPPRPMPGGLLNPAAFKSIPYTVYCFAGVVAFLGLYTVLTYIDVSATSVGVSSDFSFYLVSIANSASLFGRLSSGLATDRFGVINVLAPMSGVAAVMTYIWPLARSRGSFIAVAIVYGYSSGAYVSSFILPIYHMGGIEDVGRRAGMAVTLTAFGAVAGPPISGAINTASGGYRAVGIYAGSVILLAIAMMLFTRWLVLKSVWGKF
ncbi:MFS domain-containing protein [Mycena indigotica]|uniref:MFS domain-containing protein n=1 Tax=Mycena indigotica TaxID=2126181 RepID=A0A8H6TE50_9AGAR|nr:MFS domain-containing protein [Mycena indigotica]KAF7315071.1 MFS domain-containing protein [Mycena indigotica]